MQLYIDDRLILEWEKDYTKVIHNHLLPFELRDRIIDTYQNDSVWRERNQKNNENVIKQFLSNRVLDLDRDNAQKLLQAYQYPSRELSDDERMQIALDCHCVSITDSYWTKDNHDLVTWKDINIRTNSLNKVVQSIALQGKDLTLQGKPHTPELTNQGCFAKAWVRDGDNLFLCKGAKSNESYNEVHQEILASKVLDCTNISHVNYEYYQFEDMLTCKCNNIVTEEKSIVPAEHIIKWCENNNLDFYKFVMDIDAEYFAQMTVADYIIHNSDRHLKNWGFLHDNQTGNLTGLHPLFDHNYAFDQHTDLEDTVSKLDMHCTLKEVATRMLPYCNFQWTKEVQKDWFPNKDMYHNFIQRCADLNLYKQKQIWKIQLPVYEQNNHQKEIAYKQKTYQSIVQKEKNKQIQAIRKQMNPERELDFDEYLKEMNVIGKSSPKRIQRNREEELER